MYRTMPLEEKTEKSDLIVKADEIEIIHLSFGSSDKVDRKDYESYRLQSYTTPTSVVVFEVSDVLKGNSEKVNRFIYVTGGYWFDDAPAPGLGREATILFLRNLGENFYRCIQPHSDHEIREGRVAKKGLTIWNESEEENLELSMPYDEFKSDVLAILNESNQSGDGNSE